MKKSSDILRFGVDTMIQAGLYFLEGEPEQKTWELIIKYSGDLQVLIDAGIAIVYLLNNYAVITVPEELLEFVANVPEIEYIEAPKALFFADAAANSASCINAVQSDFYSLTGKSVLVALIDSGIDFTLSDFRNDDGTTRIIALWDQTVEAYTIDNYVFVPPEGYNRGVSYSAEAIDAALQQLASSGTQNIVRSTDISGHGTAVAGIAAGNGSVRGVAFESDLVVVKLGTPDWEGFPRTTELMQAINFVLEVAMNRNQPIAVNISFGNNYGSHNGTSLLETYINDVSGVGKSLIVIGTGNEASSAGHTRGVLDAVTKMPVNVELAVGQYQPQQNVQLWKNFVDIFDIEIIAPSGQRSGVITERIGQSEIVLDGTGVRIYYGQPSPYSVLQEIYIELIPEVDYVSFGVWIIQLMPINIVDGCYQMWLPGGSARNRGTRFLESDPYLTLTIPSTAAKALSVGAYDTSTDAVADFSGRGSDGVCTVLGGCIQKPDLVAPGVNITTTRVGGGYTTVTGTSFATPFVTGSAALLMEWGIIQGNNPYLYGERLKAYLQSGARRLSGTGELPNSIMGYGALCLLNSLQRLI